MPSSKLKLGFNVRRNGIPIRRYFLPRGVVTGISHGRSFTEAQACMGAGLDYWKWRNGDYPPWFRAEVVAWYELSSLVKRHTEVAAEKAAKAKGPKGK